VIEEILRIIVSEEILRIIMALLGIYSLVVSYKISPFVPFPIAAGFGLLGGICIILAVAPREA
jgi:hypothetical protein